MHIDDALRQRHGNAVDVAGDIVSPHALPLVPRGFGMVMMRGEIALGEINATVYTHVGGLYAYRSNAWSYASCSCCAFDRCQNLALPTLATA